MFAGSTKYDGLVRLTTDEGLTGLVCNDKDSWSHREANIVCMQLFGTTARSTTSSVCITLFSLCIIHYPRQLRIVGLYFSGWLCDMGGTSGTL